MFSLSLSYLPAASTAADKFDAFFDVYLVIGTLLFVATLGAGIYFAIKYKRKREGEETPYIPHNYLVEFLSIFGISVWAAVFFIWGWNDYKYILSPKMDEYEINVIGQQWSWQMQYENGTSLVNELYIPRGRPIKLIMASRDVLHSFYVPEFRVKQDVVPGQFSTLRFTPTKTGEYNIFCAEYCGTAHSGMLGKVHVLEPEDFQKWLDGAYKKPAVVAGGASVEAPSMVALGAKLFKERDCASCHSVNGSSLIGPSLAGLFNAERELIGGTKVQVDENYLRESIMDPMKKVVKGFSPRMPTYRGRLTDEEMNQLIAFIKSIK